MGLGNEKSESWSFHCIMQDSQGSILGTVLLALCWALHAICQSLHCVCHQREVPARQLFSVLQGFGALRELIPHKDRMDKAALLMQGVEYIKQMQVGLSPDDKTTKLAQPSADLTSTVRC